MSNDLPTVLIEPFDPKRHSYRHFDCGIKRLNNYLQLTAKKQQSADLSRVFVLIETGKTEVLGYYAINTGAIPVSEVGDSLKHKPSHGQLPVLFLGQIAVVRQMQNRSLGKILMYSVFERACFVAKQVGCYAPVLDIFSDGDENAFAQRKNWYESFGFKALSSTPNRMFITIVQMPKMAT